MSKARAAEIWAGLEARLIERCGLPDGRMLDVERPNLIRMLGRAAAGQTVSPPLPQQDAYAKRIKVRAQNARKSAQMREQSEQGSQSAHSAMRIMRELRSDTVHDAKLAAMLERSCSLRVGYDGDESVGYGS